MIPLTKIAKEPKPMALQSPAQMLWDRWQTGGQIDLTEFIKAHCDLSSSELISIVLVDQHQQWMRGNAVVAEGYIERFPWIQMDRSAALDLIYREYLLREQYGQVQTDEQFIERFPEFAEQLSLQLQIHRLVESQSSAANPDSQTLLYPLTDEITSIDRSRRLAWRREAMACVDPQLPVIPGYRLVELLGQGGMGAVYLGWHAKLNRQVAIKVVRESMWSDPTSRGRFRTEARATARLNHPNIVQIYEVGEIDGQLFFSLEYCRGGSLKQWLAGTPLPARLAAHVNLPICLAVHHAHQRGIIHRDLKPENIVLQYRDDQPIEPRGANIEQVIPKVTDFGLARSQEELGKTQADSLIGTPSYMSPEQARGSQDVTQLSDVYSLGAILYEMLTGRPPFKGSSVMETVHQVMNEEPVPPVRLNPTMPRDLQTVCLKALQKEPTQRYASALELADDLQRFLDGKPVKARPVSTVERSYRWVKRNPGWASALATVGVLLAVAWQLTMINVAQTRASLRALQQEQNKTLLEHQRAETALSQAEQGLYLASVAQANTAWNSLSMSSMKPLLDQCPPRLRRWEWGYLNNLNQRRDDYWRKQSSSITTMAWDPLRQHLATANLQGQISIYHSDDPKPLMTRQLEILQRQRMAFLNDGNKLVFVQGTSNELSTVSRGTRIVAINRHDDGSTPFVWGPDKPFGIADFTVCSAKNRFAVTIFRPDDLKQAGYIKVFSSDTWPPTELGTSQLPAGGCPFIHYSVDGQRIAVAGVDPLIYILDATTLEVEDTLEAADVDTKPDVAGLGNVKLMGKDYLWAMRAVHRISFSPDGTLLAAAMHLGGVKVWDVAMKKQLLFMKSEDDLLSHLQISKDNRRLAIVTNNSEVVRLYDLQTGRQVAAHQGHQGRITSLAFQENGDLLTSSDDGSVRRWGASDQSNNHVLVGHSQTVLGTAFHADGKTLATGEGNMLKPKSPGKILLWELESRRLKHQIDVDASVGAMRYQPNGQRLAVACGDNSVRIFDESLDSPAVLKGHKFPVVTLDWSPTKNELASVSGSLVFAALPGDAIIWDTNKMQQRMKLVGHTAALSSVAYSPDGDILITGSADKTVKVWDAESGQCLRTLTDSKDPVLSVVYDPKGRWIAAGSGDVFNAMTPKPGAIHIWNTSNWELERELRGHGQLVHALSVTNDGSRLVSCARNDKVRLWDTQTGREMLTLSPSDFASGVCFSPDSRYMVVPNWSGKIDLFVAESVVK